MSNIRLPSLELNKISDATPAEALPYRAGKPGRPPTNPDTGLTYRQEAFCIEYIKDLNQSKAAARAGYPEKRSAITGCMLMKDPKIRAHIEKIREQAYKQNRLSPDEIIKRLQRIAQKTEDEGDYTSAIRALELVGKNMAMWTDRTISDTTIRNPLSTGEDAEAIERDVKRLAKVAAPLLKLVPTQESPNEYAPEPAVIPA